jgi:hypothetical protein
MPGALKKPLRSISVRSNLRRASRQ